VEKRLKCKTCSNYLSHWGTTASGKKRWYYRICHTGRIFSRK